jgi:hypothetical protein
MNDRERHDRRDADDEDYPRQARRDRRDGSSGPRSKDLSVLGVISLVIGVISVALSFVPCLGIFTLPLPILGVVLAIVGVLISAIGQRDGVGIPVSAVAVNLLACVLPVAMTLGFCTLMGRGVQQAAQQAVIVAEANQERLEAEQRSEMVTKTTSVVGVFAAPQGGPLLGATTLNGVYPPPPVSLVPVGAPTINVDQLVREYETTPLAADLMYGKKALRIQGLVERVKLNDDEITVVVLQGTVPGGLKKFIECVFDDERHEPAADKVKKGRRVIIEGICDGSEAVDKPIRFHACRLAN